MFCLVALIIFSILGIFSATHRRLAKEAVECVFRRITFRPCQTGFREKIKGRILAKLLNRSTLAARLFNRHFELLAWVFFILMIGSSFWVVKGGYNFYVYGSCNGLNKDGFCLFDPAGDNHKVSAVDNICSEEEPSEDALTLSGLNIDQFPNKQAGSGDKLVFIGCYGCDYSRRAYPIIQKLLKKNKIDYTFIHFPVKSGTDYLSNYVYCAYKADREKFWQFNDLLFDSDKQNIVDRSYVDGLVRKVGFDSEKIKECVNSEETQTIVAQQFEEIQKINIYGTPTIFINNQPLVGPKPYRVYKRMLKTK